MVFSYMNIFEPFLNSQLLIVYRAWQFCHQTWNIVFTRVRNFLPLQKLRFLALSFNNLFVYILIDFLLAFCPVLKSSQGLTTKLFLSFWLYSRKHLRIISFLKCISWNHNAYFFSSRISKIFSIRFVTWPITWII